jgi:hypothetical protein
MTTDQGCSESQASNLEVSSFCVIQKSKERKRSQKLSQESLVSASVIFTHFVSNNQSGGKIQISSIFFSVHLVKALIFFLLHEIDLQTFVCLFSSIL